MPKQVKLHWLFLASLLNNTGAAMLWPLTTIYVHDYLHESMATAGVVMLIISLAMMVGNYVGGWLFDHWSPYGAVVGPVTIAVLATVGLLFFNGWPLFAVWLAIISWADGASLTVVNAYGTAVKGTSTRRVFNLLYMALNVGVVIGTLLVGVLLPIRVELVFEFTCAFYLVYLLVVVLTLRVPVTRVHQSRPVANGPTEDRARVGIVYLLCLCLVTVYLAYALWETVMAVHIVAIGIPFFQYSLLWTINGLLIVFFQPLVGILDGHVALRTQILGGIAIFATSFIFLIWARSFAWLTVDFVILTVGEMVGLPAVPAYVARLTAPAAAGRYQGLPNVAMSIGRAIGPLYGGLVVDHLSYNFLFLSSAILIFATLLVLALVTRAVRRDAPAGE